MYIDIFYALEYSATIYQWTEYIHDDNNCFHEKLIQKLQTMPTGKLPTEKHK